MKVTTVIYLEKDNQFLFLFRNKKKNDYNANKYIGIGGHLEDGETIKDCLIREVKEETNKDLVSFDYLGKVLFENTIHPLEVIYVFKGKLDNYDLKECEEGTFEFVNKDKIMDLELWEGDKLFLPYLNKDLRNKVFDLHLYYEGDLLVKYDPIKYQSKLDALPELNQKLGYFN